MDEKGQDLNSSEGSSQYANSNDCFKTPKDRSTNPTSKKDAMKKRIAQIVNLEDRAFSSKDLAKFHVDGKLVTFTYGTVRNYLHDLKNQGEIIGIGNSEGKSFYTVPEKGYLKPATCHNRIVSVIPEACLKRTPIYNWLIKQPADMQALHDIRITFFANGIWDRYSQLYPTDIEINNKDIELPLQTYFGYMEFKTRVHRTNKGSVSIGCPGRPIAIETKDLLQFIEALTRAEISYATTANANANRKEVIIIPPFRSWIVKMWHCGIDVLNTYEKKEFHVTIEEGISDLYRIYTKRLDNGRDVVRLEHQEYPNQQLYDAILNKLYDNNGELIDTN